jgi:predicted ATPase/DNA-binding XRE family transcriptional regulator
LPDDRSRHAKKSEACQFGDLLRSHRVRSGLSQQALAQLSTISERAIRDLEAGRAKARPATVRLLTDALRLLGAERAAFAHSGLGGQPAFEVTGLTVPQPVSALLGREKEVATLAEGLESRRGRMVALSGLPGVGKTRIAVEVATRLSQRHGWPALWISRETRAHDELGRVLSPLTRAILAVLESGAEDDIAAAVRLAGQRDALLVLDGIGDLMQPKGVEELLAYCPGLRVISTSRAPLHLAGLHSAVVSPLPTPEAIPAGPGRLSDLMRVPAVRLFLDRLSQVSPGVELSAANASAAAELCRRLDGLPVALEAVAGRFRVLGLRQLAELPSEELLETSVRAGTQQTIGGLLRWSLDRQEPGPRAILRKLASGEGQLTAADLARLLQQRPDTVLHGLSVLTGYGLVQALHGDRTTALHVPNLLRACLQ